MRTILVDAQRSTTEVPNDSLEPRAGGGRNDEPSIEGGGVAVANSAETFEFSRGKSVASAGRMTALGAFPAATTRRHRVVANFPSCSTRRA